MKVYSHSSSIYQLSYIIEPSASTGAAQRRSHDQVDPPPPPLPSSYLPTFLPSAPLSPPPTFLPSAPPSPPLLLTYSSSILVFFSGALNLLCTDKQGQKRAERQNH